MRLSLRPVPFASRSLRISESLCAASRPLHSIESTLVFCLLSPLARRLPYESTYVLVRAARWPRNGNMDQILPGGLRSMALVPYPSLKLTLTVHSWLLLALYAGKFGGLLFSMSSTSPMRHGI